MKRWYKLDNAAKVFPSVSNEENSAVYRVSAILTEEINPEILQKAVNHIYDRFAMFFVRLGKGLFWYYLDSNEQRFVIEEEKRYPCRQMHYKTTKGYMIRVLYHHKRISVEVFHSLADGGGALELLKSLIYYYLIFSGKTINHENSIILAESSIDPEETDDSFSRYYKHYEKNQLEQSKYDPKEKAYPLRGTKFPNGGVHVTTGIVTASDLNRIAKEKGTTLTGYVTALLLYSIYETRLKYERSNRPAMAALPVSMRKIFPSGTLRNFFIVIMIGQKMNKEVTLDELIQMVSNGMKEQTTKEYLQYRLFVIGKYDKVRFNKVVPLGIKRFFINTVFNTISEVKRTITVSNLGLIKVPSDMYQYVQVMEAILYPTTRCPYNCSLSSFNDKLLFNFARNVEEKDIIRFFFTWLTQKENLPVTVYSNNWEDAK